MEFWTDPPFRYVKDDDGVTWCYNPDYGNFINIDTSESVKESEVPEAVRKRLLRYSDDDEFDDNMQRIIDKVIKQRQG